MKRFYFILCAVSFFLMVCTCFYPPSTGFPINKRLLIKSLINNWELKFNTPDHTLLGLTEEKGKTSLLLFLQDHTYDSPARAALAAASLVAFIFSLVGWYREKYLEKKAKQGPQPCR